MLFLPVLHDQNQIKFLRIWKNLFKKSYEFQFNYN